MDATQKPLLWKDRYQEIWTMFPIMLIYPERNSCWPPWRYAITRRSKMSMEQNKVVRELTCVCVCVCVSTWQADQPGGLRQYWLLSCPRELLLVIVIKVAAFHCCKTIEWKSTFYDFCNLYAFDNSIPFLTIMHAFLIGPLGGKYIPAPLRPHLSQVCVRSHW